jgi:hypothetical protein
MAAVGRNQASAEWPQTALIFDSGLPLARGDLLLAAQLLARDADLS